MLVNSQVKDFFLSPNTVSCVITVFTCFINQNLQLLKGVNLNRAVVLIKNLKHELLSLWVYLNKHIGSLEQSQNNVKVRKEFDPVSTFKDLLSNDA